MIDATCPALWRMTLIDYVLDIHTITGYRKTGTFLQTTEKRLTTIQQEKNKSDQARTHRHLKENSVLFVTGFSFADEHLKEITQRVLQSNPTLIIPYSDLLGMNFSQLFPQKKQPHPKAKLLNPNSS